MGLRCLIRHNGGLFKSILVLARTDDLKVGKFVGTDVLGNSYFENDCLYFFGKNRWVIYNDRFGYDYDGSCVGAHWFRWLHHMTETPPNREPEREIYKWMLPHEENKTGTSEEYIPYSTTPPKIVPWRPVDLLNPPRPCFSN